MERLDSINPDRIIWCCTDRRIGLDELSAETQISYKALDRALNREAGLTFNQLQKIASYFGRGILFFLEPGPVDENLVHTTNFRTLANQKPALSPKTKLIIERTEKQREAYLQLLVDLDLEDTQSFRPPDLVGMNADQAAAEARAWLGVGETNSFDTYRSAIEAAGILVFRSNGYSGKWQIPRESPILGFSLYDETCPLIFVRKQNAESRQTFTLAHELGHLLLHRASSIDDEQDVQATDGIEREANAFAGNLLVPSRFLDSIVDDERPPDVSSLDGWLEDYRRSWGVSTEVILRRLLDSRRIDRATYHAYRDWRARQPESTSDGGARSYRHREPKHLFGDKFVRTVLDSLNARKITITRASRYLDSLKLKDLHQLTEFYAGH